MKFIYVIWISVFFVFIILSVNFNGNSTNFYGIAETKEIVINSKNPVEIKKIHTVQGQIIQVGDTVLELNRPELNIKISEISHLRSELIAQKKVKTNLSQSQIHQLKAEQASKINEIKSQIKELEAQYDLNKKLTGQLRSIEDTKTQNNKLKTQSPILMKIISLKRELRLALNPSQITINRIKKELLSTNDPVEIQVQRLENELKLLLEERDKLLIVSSIDGVIGSVDFKEGEKVSPFTPIITLHTKSPSYVKGYIHENVYNKVIISQNVIINSLADKKTTIVGSVVGVGARIVEYPVRLRKRQEIQIWGREVLIKIPKENRFLLGEKVSIKPIELNKSLLKNMAKPFQSEQTP